LSSPLLTLTAAQFFRYHLIFTECRPCWDLCGIEC